MKCIVNFISLCYNQKRDFEFYCEYIKKADHIQISYMYAKLVLNDIIDKFGSDVYLSELDENKLCASFDVSPHGLRFGHCNICRVLR